MRKLILLLVLSVLFVGSVLPIAAQETWSAWLYNPQLGRMTRVGSAGMIEEFTLQLPAGYTEYPQEKVAVAPNGTTMAYMVRGSDDTQQLVIYDHTTATIIATYPPGDILAAGFNFDGRYVFKPDSSALAFGYMLEDTWEIIVIDTNTLTLNAGLRGTEPAAAIVQGITGFDLPMIQQFLPDNRVAFTVIPYATDAPPPYPGYIWDINAGVVSESAGYSTPSPDIFAPTGEVISALVDERLPLPSAPEENFGPYLPVNTLQVYDPNSGERFPFYHDGTVSLGSPRFAYNGAYIALRSGGVSSERQWIVIDRSGAYIGQLPTGSDIIQVEGTDTGLIYLSRPSNSAPSVVNVDLRAGTITGGNLVWQGDPNLNREQIVWVGRLGPEDLYTLTPVAPWSQLAQPILDGSTPIVFDDSPGERSRVLRAGEVATVSTTGGDSLNMRTGPSISFAIREKLERGTQVTLLEGPVNADGFTWWRIRTPSGREGWTVDFADNEETLVPGTSPGTGGDIDESIEGGADPNLPTLLNVGDDALVTLNTQRDALRLRNIAGLDGRIISLMPDGTRVSVIDGPIAANDYTWWRLRTPEGNVGWAVEIVGSERTLVQAPPETPTDVPPSGSLATVMLTAPAPGTLITGIQRRVTFNWSVVPDATAYTIQVQNCTTDCTDFFSVTVPNNFYTTDFSSDGSYRWRVQAGASGAVGPWSSWWSLSIDAD